MEPEPVANSGYRHRTGGNEQPRAGVAWARRAGARAIDGAAGCGFFGDVVCGSAGRRWGADHVVSGIVVWEQQQRQRRWWRRGRTTGGGRLLLGGWSRGVDGGRENRVRGIAAASGGCGGGG